MARKKEPVWEPPPLNPRKFEDPFRPQKKKAAPDVKKFSGIPSGTILRRKDGYLYLAP